LKRIPGLWENSFAPEKPHEYLTFSPMALTCPQMQGETGEVCELLEGEVEIVHVQRIEEAARMNAAVKDIQEK
jgi:hypothetical protein